MNFSAAMLATLLVAAPANGPSDTAPRHEDEIEIFANLMALAQVASDHCADILINLPLLAEFQRRAHVVAADDAAVSRFGRAAIASYTATFAELPSQQAWCDAVYKRYGPAGTIIPYVLRRQP